MVSADDTLISAMTRTMQIIAAALMMGIAAFFAVVLIARTNVPPPDIPIVSYLAVGMLLLNLPLAMVIPQAMIRNRLRDLSAKASRTESGGETGLTRELLTIRQSSMIIVRALLEAPAFLGLIAYMIEGQIWVLAVPGVALLVMLAIFPTEGGNRTWLNRQREQLDELARSADASM